MTRTGRQSAIAALCAFTLLGAACGNSNDVTGLQDAQNTDDTSAPVEPVDSEPDPEPADTEPASADTEPEPADTEPEPEGFLFESPDGDYTLIFPGEPTRTPLPIDLPTGQVIAETFIYEDGLDAAYFTSVFAYEEGTTDPDPEVVLTGARDGAVANVGGTLIDSTFVERDGIPGIAFTFAVVDGVDSGDGNALIFFDEPRLYQSFALGFADQQAAFQAFIDTFSFTDQAEGDS